jgi:site-specific DNA-methyltransferase (adenine-specific)
VSDVDTFQGDCREVLACLEADSLDAVVTDPPYELGFMGKGWDRTGVSNDPATWAAVMRVMKPGAYLLAFGGTRTYHRMVCAIEDAGFEIRDSLHWIYGTGFPKSLNLGGGRGTALKPAHLFTGRGLRGTKRVGRLRQLAGSLACQHPTG